MDVCVSVCVLECIHTESLFVSAKRAHSLCVYVCVCHACRDRQTDRRTSTSVHCEYIRMHMLCTNAHSCTCATSSMVGGGTGSPFFARRAFSLISFSRWALSLAADSFPADDCSAPATLPLSFPSMPDGLRCATLSTTCAYSSLSVCWSTHVCSKHRLSPVTTTPLDALPIFPSIPPIRHSRNRISARPPV